MNPVVIGVLAAGAVFGLAVGVLVIYWLVPQRVSLRDALALDRTMLSAAVLEQEALLAPANPAGSRWAGFARRLEDRLAGWRLTTPDESLALIEWSRGRFLLTRVGFTLAAVLIGPAVLAARDRGRWIGRIRCPAGVVAADRPGRLVRGGCLGDRASSGAEAGNAGGADVLPDSAGAVQGVR